MSNKIDRYCRFDHVHVRTPSHVGMQFKKKNYAHYITTMSPPFKVQITNRHTLDKFEPTCELRPCVYFLNGWLIECCNHVNQVSVLEL